VASVEPRATVTIKSKAFIFERVLLPDTRNKMISDTYTHRYHNGFIMLSQLSKNIFFIMLLLYLIPIIS
jgi:hypothetical protein